MLEILRAQIRQILGGRMKWLVLACLTLPILLTVAAVTSGGLGEIQRELQQEETATSIASGYLPEGAREVTWEGTDLEFAGGKIQVTEEGIFYAKSRWNGQEEVLSSRRIDPGEVILINDGYLVTRDGRLWINDALEPDGSRWTTRLTSRRDPADLSEAGPTIGLRVIYAGYLFVLYPQALCLLMALLYGTSVLGAELDGKTLPYLFSRPLPRWQFVIGKYLGIVISLLVPTCISLLISAAVLGALTDGLLILSLLAGTAGALFAYNAVFTLFGFITPRRGMIVALVYGILFEVILSFVPALVNQATVTYYLRSLVVEILDIPVPIELSRIVGGASLQGSLIALAVIMAIALGLSSMMASGREYVVKDDA